MVADPTSILRAMPTSPGPVLAALDALWQRIRANVGDLPPILPIISPTQGRTDHGPMRWGTTDDGTVTGLVITADVLRAGPDAVVLHMLHEAAHVLNWIRGVEDTTSRGAYHTQAFLTAAEEVGLVWPADARRSAAKGYAAPVLSDTARRRHAEDVATLGPLIDDLLPRMELPSTNRRRTDRLTLRCSCDPPRSFRISQTVAAQGPIVCGVCETEFKEV